MPQARRGNRADAWRKRSRLESIQQAIDAVSNIKEDGQSNILFFTLTLAQRDITKKESFKILQREVPKCITRLKKILGIESYLRNIEAHASGYAHAHIVVVTEKPMHTDFYSSSRKEDEAKKARSQKVHDALKASWTLGHVDDQLATSTDVARYITKEIGKYALVEKAVRKGRKCEPLKMWEVKAIRTIYMALQIPRLRIYQPSKKLGKRAKEIQEEREKAMQAEWKEHSGAIEAKELDIKKQFRNHSELLEIIEACPPLYDFLKTRKSVIKSLRQDEGIAELVRDQENLDDYDRIVGRLKGRTPDKYKRLYSFMLQRGTAKVERNETINGIVRSIEIVGDTADEAELYKKLMAGDIAYRLIEMLEEARACLVYSMHKSCDPPPKISQPPPSIRELLKTPHTFMITAKHIAFTQKQHMPYIYADDEEAIKEHEDALNEISDCRVREIPKDMLEATTGVTPQEWKKQALNKTLQEAKKIIERLQDGK